MVRAEFAVLEGGALDGGGVRAVAWLLINPACVQPLDVSWDRTNSNESQRLKATATECRIF